MSDKKSGLHLSQWNPATTTDINPQPKTFSEQLRGLADKLSYDPDRFDGWVDTFNYNVGKTIWGANAPLPGDPGHNRWVDLLMNLGTIAVGVVGTIKAARLVGSYIQEASKFIKTIQTAKSQPPNKEVTTLSPVFKKTADVYRQFAWKGDAVDPKIVADALFDVDPTMNKATADAMAKYILDPSMGAVSDVAAKKTMEQATPVLIRMAEKLSPMEVTTIAKQAEATVLSRYGILSLPSPASKPTIPLGGKVQSTPQVIAAGGKVAEPQVVTTPTVSADKYEVSHPLPERPNSTAKRHLPLKADADISAFIEKHAALTEKPEAVMDKTVPAINLQKSGSVDITDRVDLASVQVKYPTATTVVLDPKRRTVMFLHDTTPLEAIAIDKPQLKAWYGIDGNKILGEITQPQIVQEPVAQIATPEQSAVVAPQPTAEKQPWEITLRDALSSGVQWDVPESVDAAARAVAEKEVKKMDAYKREHKKDLEYKKMGIMRGWGGFASDGPSDVTEMARVFNDVFTKEVHREAVRGALSEGKPVPPEVLADYPDLARTAAQPAAVATEQTAPVATRAPATRYKQSTLPPENYDDYSWMNKYPQPKEPWQMTNAEIQKLWDNRPTVDEGESMDWSGWRHISVGTYGKTSSGVPAQYAISPDGYWYEYDHNSHGYYPITHGGEFSKDLHEMDVRAALKKGKPVPAEVLAEYPELQQPLKSGGKLEISNGEQAIHTTPSPSPSLSPSPAVTATTPAPATAQNTASPQGLATTSDVVTPENAGTPDDPTFVDRWMKNRSGSTTIGTVLRSVNPIYWIDTIDPLRWIGNKSHFYNLLYGAENMKDIRAFRGNPSVVNTRIVPRFIKHGYLWGYGLTPDTQDAVKDVRINARHMYSELADLMDETVKLNKEKFLRLLTDISGSNLAVPAGAPGISDLANRWIAFQVKAADDLVANGKLDPQIFARFRGHYIPAPYDNMGQHLPSIEETEHLRPGMGWVKEQKMTPAQIIGAASKDFEDYRDFFFQRMRSEVRAAEKGGVFNAVAADPKAMVMPEEKAPKDYIRIANDKALNAFDLAGKAVPGWVSLFLRNEFADASEVAQLRGWYRATSIIKWLKAGVNLPTIVRNYESQLTVQMMEGGVTPLDVENFFIRPLSALLGFDKAGKAELMRMGIIDSDLRRSLEGIVPTEEERASWRKGNRAGAIHATLSRLGKVAGRVRDDIGLAYGFADNWTKSAIYFANKEKMGPYGARNMAFITSGDYTSRPPMVNYLTRGLWNGRKHVAWLLFQDPFAFYKVVVGPSRAGNMLVNHPTLFLAELGLAYLAGREIIKQVAKKYNIAEEQAERLIMEMQNYKFLQGKMVIPISEDKVIDATPLIPMAEFFSQVGQELGAHKELWSELLKWSGFFLGSDAPSAFYDMFMSLRTNVDQNALRRYGKVYRVGPGTWEKTKWLFSQFLPGWINSIIRTLSDNEPLSWADFIGDQVATATDEDKVRYYNGLRRSGQYTPAELNRIYNALFKGTSLTGK